MCYCFLVQIPKIKRVRTVLNRNVAGKKKKKKNIIYSNFNAKFTANTSSSPALLLSAIKNKKSGWFPKQKLKIDSRLPIRSAPKKAVDNPIIYGAYPSHS